MRLPADSTTWLGAAARRLALALVIGAVVGWAAESRGATVTAGKVGSAAPGHRCKCGDACSGASCCCSHGPKPARRATSARAEASTGPRPSPMGRPAGRARPGPDPCVRAAPCGDPSLPPDSPGEPIGRAALDAAIEIQGATPRRRASLGMRVEAPRRRAERIDEPPEAVAAT